MDDFRALNHGAEGRGLGLWTRGEGKGLFGTGGGEGAICDEGKGRKELGGKEMLYLGALWVGGGKKKPIGRGGERRGTSLRGKS